MSKRTRKRKLEGNNDAEIKEYTDVLSDQFRDEMATMWEIPQIFHFLHISKEVFHFSHLSMYEMERMLAMPRASKQLAHIMTCLLSPPLPKARMRKIPPMPYDFWVNVLTHKIKGWFKVYQSKHQDILKVLDAIGVEPEFWRIFPDDSFIDDKDFDKMSFRERVWIVKTLCDTIMHSRKTVHEEVIKQCTDEQGEVILGTDRHGAKYFWFPLFLNNDLRVYRHCVDNTILSTVKPPPWKEGQTPGPKSDKLSRKQRNGFSTDKPDKLARKQRKRSRWKNGALPVRRSKKPQDDELKESGDSVLESLVSEDTNFSGTSGCSNNNNIAMEVMDRTRSRSLSKDLSEETGVSTVETRCSNPKSSGYDTNTSSDAKSVNGVESEEMFRGFGNEIDNENSLDVICSVKGVLNRLISSVSELVDGDENPRVRAASENASAVGEQEDEDLRSRVIGEMDFDDETRLWDDQLGVDSEWSTNYSLQRSGTPDDENFQRDLSVFTGMLGDLSVSNFELVADSLESLRDLAKSLLNNGGSEGRTRSSAVPRCEMTLARAIERLIDSLTEVEPTLKESVRKARTKLQREWANFKDGVVEDQDTSGNGDHGSNRWILGSQGCPLPPAGDATLQAVSESALSPSGTGMPAQQSPNRENVGEDADDRATDSLAAKSSEEKQPDKSIKLEQGGVKIKSEKEDSDENSNSEDSKEECEPENRRVLRRRGIPSYTELFSSDESDSYELEERPSVEAVDATPGPSDSAPAAHAAPRTGQIDDESDEEDSDQDWILPGSRRRKNKRSPTNRRLKTMQQKFHPVTGEPHDLSSNLSPRTTAGASDRPNPSNATKDTEGKEARPICKVESVHSELDIKDEGPIFEYNRGVPQPANVNQKYVMQSQNPRGPSSASYAPAAMRPAAPPVPGTLSPAQQGYYIHRPQHNYPPAGNPHFVQYPYPPVGRGAPRYPYPPGPPPYQAPPNYMQYQNYRQMPPRPPYPGNGAPPAHPGHPTLRNPNNAQRHQVPSTTLYGARMPGKAAPSRMPGPRVVSVQNHIYSGYRGTVRPRGAGVRMYPPRANATQAPQGNRMTRPPAPKQTSPKKAAPSVSKTTSLILLSDSDDEIEMIVPEKKTTAAPGSVQNRKSIPTNKNRQMPAGSGGARVKPKPVVTSEIPVSKSREVLSPQMLQRMSQGGISITPVKPQQSKQKSDTSPDTKLVVVVNETGSHYALALPNGSKLILTPEQVAQIRASNGGKLVL